MALAPGTLGYMAGTLMSPVFEGWVDELQLVLRRLRQRPWRDSGNPHRRAAVRDHRHHRLLADDLAQGRARRRLEASRAHRAPVGAPAEAARDPGDPGGELARARQRRQPRRRGSRSARRDARHPRPASGVGRAPHPHRQAPGRDLLARPPRRLSPRSIGESQGRRPAAGGPADAAQLRVRRRGPRHPRPLLPRRSDQAEGPDRRGPAAVRDPAFGRGHPGPPQLPDLAGRRRARLARRPAPAGGLHRRHSHPTRSSTSCSSSP